MRAIISNCEHIFVQIPYDNDEEPLDTFVFYLVTFIVIGTLSIGGNSLISYNRRVKIRR